ncbi:MAG TPA: hypothetical protein VIU86_20055 [Gaiellaceae bacterium]
MNIEITRAAGFVSAMGHRVAVEQGGESELRRRCLETLSHWNTPPEEIRFLRPGALAEASPELPGRQGPAGKQAQAVAAAPVAAPEAPPEPEAQPEPKPVAARRPGGPGLARAKDRRR